MCNCGEGAKSPQLDRIEESQAKHYEHLRGAIDAIASELVEQRLRLMSVTKQMFENFDDHWSLIRDVRKKLNKPKHKPKKRRK